MKRLLVWALVLVAGAALGLYLAGEVLQIQRPAPEAKRGYLTNADMGRVLTDPKKEKGKPVVLDVQIVSDPEYDAEGTHFQALLLVGTKDRYIVVDYPANLEVTGGDLVRLKGRVGAPFVGRTDDGAELVSVRINADKLTPAKPEDIFAPAKAVWKTGVTKEARGVRLSVKRVEFGADETRFYVEAQNRTAEPVVIHLFNSVATQRGKAFELKPNPRAGYKELPVDIAGGATDSGILVFPAMRAAGPSIDLSLEISGRDWESAVVLPLLPLSGLRNILK